MKTKHILLPLLCAAVSLPSMAESQLIKALPDNGLGKQNISIHSFSSQTNGGEGAYNLLFDDGNSKWCDNQNQEPWVILELNDYYKIDRFVFRDVKTKENGNYFNIDEYRVLVSTTGTEDADFTEILHKTGQKDLNVKDETLAEPVEARYVKFIPKRGEGDNAIRIYGIDLYGSYSRPVDRGELISVGKTVMKFYDAVNQRESAINMLDGNTTNKNNKWCFHRAGDSDPLKYMVIDLEKTYDINKFAIYDCKTLEPDDNITGCNIYVSETAPSLELIGNTGDENTCWTEVVNSNDEGGVNVKEYALSAPVKGRYVKLVIPRDKTTGTVRLFQFEVYGTEVAIESNNANLASLSVPGHVMSPLFTQENTDYTIDVKKEVEKITIEASAFSENATVEGTGEKSLSIGTNTFAVTVTAEDGETQKTYNLTINRAALSDIAKLKSLRVSAGLMLPKFNENTYEYEVDVRGDVDELEIFAEAGNGATIEGAGVRTVDNPERYFRVNAVAENGNTQTYTIKVLKAPKNLISASDDQGRGKRIVTIHSYSEKASDNESPYKLLLPERKTYSGNTSMKWCDNKNGDRSQSWVIFSLAEMYKVYQIGFRDGYLVENVKNTTDYHIYVSTTGTEDADFTEVASATNVGDLSTKVATFEPVDARYIKLVVTKGSNAVWMYGVDIYGTLSENKIERGDLVSVGKTIINHPYRWSDRETAANLIDGENAHWAFNKADGDGVVEIDLEAEYDIYKFVLEEGSDYTYGYRVDVKKEFTDDWQEVVNRQFDTNDNHLDRKEAVLDQSVSARYVRLTLPNNWVIGWSRVRKFEVYGTQGDPTGIESEKQAPAEARIYPNPVMQGSALHIDNVGECVIRIFSMQGALVLQQAAYGQAEIATGNLSKGTYLLQVVEPNGIKQSKMVVR